MLHAWYKRDRDEALADRDFKRADKLERDMDGVLLEIERYDPACQRAGEEDEHGR
jgi:hypothetical protein